MVTTEVMVTTEETVMIMVMTDTIDIMTTKIAMATMAATIEVFSAAGGLESYSIEPGGRCGRDSCRASAFRS